MYENVKMQLDVFWHSYIRAQLFSVQSFAWCLKFPIHEFFRSDVLYEHYLTSDFRTNTVISRLVTRLPIKIASKTMIRSIIIYLSLMKTTSGLELWCFLFFCFVFFLTIIHYNEILKIITKLKIECSKKQTCWL